MEFHVMTLFPDMIMDGLNTSITGRAIKAGVMSVKAYDIREYSNDKHLKVDDYPYGGGAGMVMRAAPVCDCYEDIVRNIGKRPRVVYMTPQGYTFTQSMAEEFAKEDNLVILCGHYEGIDERALENIVTDFVSIGDYENTVTKDDIAVVSYGIECLLNLCIPFFFFLIYFFNFFSIFHLSVSNCCYFSIKNHFIHLFCEIELL